MAPFLQEELLKKTKKFVSKDNILNSKKNNSMIKEWNIQIS